MIEDLVCNKPLTIGAEPWACRYHGHTLFFCSLACKERFELEPEGYLVTPPQPLPLPSAVLMMR